MLQKVGGLAVWSDFIYNALQFNYILGTLDVTSPACIKSNGDNTYNVFNSQSKTSTQSIKKKFFVFFLLQNRTAHSNFTLLIKFPFLPYLDSLSSNQETEVFRFTF